MEAQYRGTCRGQVTKICKNAMDYIKTVNFEEIADRGAVEQDLVIYLERLKNARANLQKADAMVQPLIKEDFSKECESVVEYDDKSVAAIAKLEYLLKSKFNVDTHHQPPDPISSRTDTSHQNQHIKLKSFELMKFNGDFESWLPFWEQFKRAVHENSQFNAATKFNFLNSALIGQAAATIAGFTPTEKCYNDAISLLLEEYGNTDKIVEKYIQKLMRIKPVQAAHDARGLRHLYNETTSIMRSLTAFEVPSSQYYIVLKSVLLGAIPSSLRVRFHRSLLNSNMNITLNTSTSQGQNSDREPDGSSANSTSGVESLSDILVFIKAEVDALEKSNLSEKVDRPRVLYKERQGQQVGTAAGLFTQTHRNEKCLFCNSEKHNISNCDSNMKIEEKKAILKRLGRCFRCAKPNHSSKFCKAQWIKCQTCSERHLTSLCEGKGQSKFKPSKAIAERNKETESQSVNLSANEEKERGRILLQTAKAFVSSPSPAEGISIGIRLIMDSGSQSTYVSEVLKNKLNLPITGTKRVRIIPFGESDAVSPVNYDCVMISIRSRFSQTKVLISAIVVPRICENVVTIPSEKNAMWKHLMLADAFLNDDNYLGGINLLIGQDNLWKFNSFDRQILTNKLVAVNTFFGWTLQGVFEGESRGNRENILLACDERDTEFDISKFWDLEQIGITKTFEREDQEDIRNVIDNIKLNEENRYEVCLPWRHSIESLNNKNLALARLRSLTNKIIKNRDKLIEYDSEFRWLLESGIAEKVENAVVNERVYYMPHKPVYREDKLTSKLRIVFDASSSERGCNSLNELLYAGDNMIPDILSVLIRFRSNRVAIIADIEKAFLQISLNKKDRDCHRFLWYEFLPNGHSKLPPICEYRMARVTFGVTSSPFLLCATINQHLKNCFNEYGSVCTTLSKSFYIDDLILSVENDKIAQDIYVKAMSILKKAQMNLRKWNSNSLAFKEMLKDKYKIDSAVEQKVLGVIWNTIGDEIRVDVCSNMEYLMSLRGTKRNIMRAMARIYDPLGIIGPFTVRVKMLLQDVWITNPEWDETLNTNQLACWQKWQDELKELQSFSIPRSLSNISFERVIERELHIFADASPKAYGAVAYIRTKSEDDSIGIELVCSKNRVSPLKKETKPELSLPKLELTATLIAARLKLFLISNLAFQIDCTYLWSDSTIALNWIVGQSNKRKPYVNHRVSEINEVTNIYEWGHCSGKDNPADLLTRGISARQLANSELWKYGPSWLKQPPMYWPEKFKVDSSLSLLAVSESHSHKSEDIIEPIFAIHTISSLQRLLRVTAYVFRFVNKARRLSTRDSGIEAMELDAAQDYWVKAIQSIEYSQELEALLKSRNCPNDSKILSLRPILIDGIIRIQSRLPSDESHGICPNPIILPKDSHLSRLLVLDIHERVFHGGVNAVLSKLRQKFWIVHGRQLIKTILQRCVICRRLHGKSGSEVWAPLPRERVIASRPFESTGVDFAGPLYIKTEGEGKKKIYIMLLTCAVIRAVHLELVPDLSVKSCVDALRRFMARRGVPQTIMSDNAKTFKRTDLELRKLNSLLKHNEVKTLASKSGISWKYIAERAAWWGGFWERLVRTVKDALKAAIGKARLSFEDLHTLIVEVEAVVNSRPLTYISNDPKDLEPLSPSHFFMNCNNVFLPADISDDRSAIAQAWHMRQTLIKRYMRRWRDDYLHQLRTLHHCKGVSLASSIKPGEVVLVHEDNKSRIFWRLAVVELTFPGRDGKIRACQIRTSNQQILRRPIQLLFPLEVSSISGAEDEENKSSSGIISH